MPNNNTSTGSETLPEKSENIFCITRLGISKGPILGMDWGKKNVGLAISDSCNKVAMPLEVVDPGAALRRRLISLWDERNIKALVIGWPVHLNGNESKTCAVIFRLALRLRQDHGWPICFWDERLSTRAVQTLIIDRKVVTDHHAAAIILQGALDRLNGLLMLEQILEN